MQTVSLTFPFLPSPPLVFLHPSPSPALISTPKLDSRVSYCSKGCQKADYKVHRTICFAIKAVLKHAPPLLNPFTPTPSIPTDPAPMVTSSSFRYLFLLYKALGDRMGRISTGLFFNARRCASCLINQSDALQQRLSRCSDCVYSFCLRDVCGKAAVEHRRSGLCSKLRQIANDERYVRSVVLFPLFSLGFFRPSSVLAGSSSYLLPSLCRFTGSTNSTTPFNASRPGILLDSFAVPLPSLSIGPKGGQKSDLIRSVPEYT